MDLSMTLRSSRTLPSSALFVLMLALANAAPANGQTVAVAQVAGAVTDGEERLAGKARQQAVEPGDRNTIRTMRRS